ncbi:MAG: hypothetical protein HYY91_03130 [Candidatus Omnitrophica bacterium]|nr:hypothetical protein [Candidatus Omnitrophota bacterium]
MMAPSSGPGVYLLLGPDRLRKRSRLEALANACAPNLLDRHQFSAAECAPAFLAGLIREQPAAGRCKLIVIDDAHRLSRECVEVLVRHQEVVRQLACVVVMTEHDVEAKHPLTALRPCSTVEEFRDAAPDAKQGFALVEAIGRRDVAAALQAMNRELAEGREAVELFGLLAWQLQRWLTVGHLLERGLPRQQIAAATKLQPWLIERMSGELAGRPTAWLRRMVQRCWERDVGAKTGRVIPRLALEELIVELCLVSSPSRRAVA